MRMKKSIIWPIILVLGSSLNGNAQEPVASSRPRFEVASIKLCENNEGPSEGPSSPGSLDLACVTTINLVRLAYLIFPTGQANVPVSPGQFQIAIRGGPSWINSDRYRIRAKSGQPVNIEMMKGPMMQALLEDRFKLKLHSESKTISVNELSVAKGGPRLTPAKEGGCVVADRNHPLPQTGAERPSEIPCGSLRTNSSGGVDILGVTMSEFCRRLSAYVDREILDKTGIEGTFDIHLDLNLVDLAHSGVPGPLSPSIAIGDVGPIASAAQKLGLQIHPAKSTGESLVIDYVERPSEN
jgi:uncharacterized protein (TIGR03435 family)